MWMLTIFAFFRLPDTVPVHFNATGTADSYGNKISFLVLPAIGTAIYLAITQLNKYPWIFNYISIITASNALQQYTIATRILRFLKLSILIVFTLITLFTYFTAMGITKGLGAWLLPFSIILLMAPTIFLLVKMAKPKP